MHFYNYTLKLYCNENFRKLQCIIATSDDIEPWRFEQFRLTKEYLRSRSQTSKQLQQFLKEAATFIPKLSEKEEELSSGKEYQPSPAKGSQKKKSKINPKTKRSGKVKNKNNLSSVSATSALSGKRKKNKTKKKKKQ